MKVKNNVKGFIHVGIRSIKAKSNYERKIGTWIEVSALERKGTKESCGFR